MSEIEDHRSQVVGLLGATSFVGTYLLPELEKANRSIVAFSRRNIVRPAGSVKWHKVVDGVAQPDNFEVWIPFWICLAPIAVLPDYFPMLEAYGARRVVALSSTSCFTKENSSDPKERDLAKSLVESEARLQAWAETRGIEWVVLRPTLIYGFGLDKNISEIARFIRRFGFFPLLGDASGLRQPIHAQDVAGACFAALRSSSVANRGYNISGAEVLTYRDMVKRIFAVLGRSPRLISIPLWMFNLGVKLVRVLPHYRKWSGAMAERMNANMVFDHDDAKQNFGFAPRRFELTAIDLPK